MSIEPDNIASSKPQGSGIIEQSSEPIEYQSNIKPPPLSKAARSVLLGCVLFACVHFGLGTLITAALVFNDGGLRSPALVLIPLSALSIGIAYFTGAYRVWLRRPFAGPILLTAISAALLTFLLVAVVIIDMLNPPVFALDFIGPALLAVFPLIEMIWIIDIVKLQREEQRAAP